MCHDWAFKIVLFQIRHSWNSSEGLRPGKLDLLFRISHLLNLCALRAVIINFLSLANATYAQQIYGPMAIKSGRVIA